MKKIIILLLTLLLSLIPLFSLFGSSYILKFREFFLTLCYIALLALLWRSKYTKILSAILLMFWILNCSISIFIYQLFNSQLNYQLAMTILSTNINEAKDFLWAYWPILLLSLLLFFSLLYCINQLSRIVSKRLLIVFSSILLVTVSYKFCESAFRGRLSDPSFNMSEKVLPYTSLYNFGIFSRAHQELTLLETVSNYQPNYLLSVKDSHIDTYVIVIGESVRRDHLSLYGYPRQTTPNIDSQKNNLFIFDQAIAPAPITTMALSSALTIKAPDDSSPNLLNDNILNVANHANFDTYWFSRQNVIGQFETVVTSIAKSAKYKEWLSSGYDDILLNKLDEALAQKVAVGKKKLIVLHTNGSHLSACNQYPQEDTYFTNGQSEYEDCYDNSILFMDKLLGNIFTKLKEHSASVLYFSDHGQQKRIKRGQIDYIHGSINPSKESIDVPQFIWFSPVVDKQDKKIGTYSQPYSTSDNYFLILNWLGIDKINDQTISSPLFDDYQSKKPIIIMDTKLNIFDYDQLQSDNSIDK